MADLRFRNDEPQEQPAVTLDAFLDQSNATAVRLEPDDDARALLPYLGRLTMIEIGFPSFRDGRGYSAARVLREAGYTGELRAQGDVLVDQLRYMRRCGFDSFMPNVPLNPLVVDRVMSAYDDAYQAASDAVLPIWRLRHG